MVWVGESFGLRSAIALPGIAMGVMILAAFLMVSNVRYYSFKDLDLRGRVPFVAVLAIVMVFVLISLEPASVLLILFGAYVVSGLGETWWARRKRKAERRAQHSEQD